VDRLSPFEPRQRFDRFAGLLPGDSQFVEGLQVEPKLRVRTKEMTKVERRVASHRARAIQDLRDAIGRHADFSREFRRAHIQRFKFLGQVFPRMIADSCHDRSIANLTPPGRG
jgi:hypothetical protein